MTTLPSVKGACFLIQPEESHREVLKINKLKVEVIALYNINERFKMPKSTLNVETRDIHFNEG